MSRARDRAQGLGLGMPRDEIDSGNGMARPDRCKHGLFLTTWAWPHDASRQVHHISGDSSQWAIDSTSRRRRIFTHLYESK